MVTGEDFGPQITIDPPPRGFGAVRPQLHPVAGSGSRCAARVNENRTVAVDQKNRDASAAEMEPWRSFLAPRRW